MAHDAPPGPTPSPEAKPRLPLALEDVFAAACMAALALITFANVILRYLTDESIAWTEEISIALMVVMTLAAAGAAVARERHIRIDYFLQRGSPRRQRLFELIGAGAVVLLFAAMTVLGARMAWDEYRFGETSPGIGVPKWWYSVWLPILSAAIALRGAGVFARNWRRR
jgi:TRAP-type C4-dicarboxylate transport system permease small subunit